MKICSDNLLCGMDGGGTVTKVVVCDRTGQIMLSFHTGTINHYGAGSKKVTRCFAGIAKKLKENLGCLPGIIFTGNSAFYGLAPDIQVHELTRGVFGSSKVIFHSDVYVALLGFTMGDPGAVIIAGTGSMACGIDPEGNYHTAGGWGHILGDEGSAYHIAIKGIKAALHAHDGLEDPTLLSGRVLDFFRINAMTELIDLMNSPQFEKSIIAAFASEVEKAAYEEDKVAIKILDNEAKWLYRLARAITGKCKTRILGYYGSVLHQNDKILSQLAARLKHDSIQLKVPMFSPEIGALIGAFRVAGIETTKTILDNLSEYK